MSQKRYGMIIGKATDVLVRDSGKSRCDFQTHTHTHTHTHTNTHIIK
jgi:hypothetical protein